MWPLPKGRSALRWDRGGPHPLIDEWARDVSGSGRRALIVGSGLGPDAELFAERGFDVVAFDVSSTAIATACRRFPQSHVDYWVANLLDAPSDWSQAFDLVVESLTVQSLPVAFHAQAIANVSRMVAPGGTLLVIARHAMTSTVPSTGRRGRSRVPRLRRSPAGASRRFGSKTFAGRECQRDGGRSFAARRRSSNELPLDDRSGASLSERANKGNGGYPLP